MDKEKRRERYIRDPLPVRLGGLAANLARIGSVSENPANRMAVDSMLHESKYFIEWTAVEFPIDVAVELIELQLQLSSRHFNWTKNSENEESRIEMSQWAKFQSKAVLERSGLLSEK